MKRLLIADAQTGIGDAIALHLSGEWDVQICKDDTETMDRLQQQLPEAMIICHDEPILDACSILANCFPELPPAILIIASSISDDEFSTLARWGADCILEPPYDPNHIGHVLNFLHNSDGVAAKRLMQHLRVLGISAGTGGYIYLLTAISMFRQDMTLQLHNDVYCKIAQDTDVDERAVEKATRTLIHNAFKRRNINIWARYFPVNAKGETPCPTNKEFIMTLAQMV